MNTESQLQGVVHLVGGGSGWSKGDPIYRKTNMKTVRQGAEQLLTQRRLPMMVVAGHVDECGERTQMAAGLGSCFTIFWRAATSRELYEFDYDTWLVDEFPRDNK